MCFLSAVWPNFWDPSTLKIFFAYGYSMKKSTQHSIIWRWAVLCKKQNGGWIQICEIFTGKSIKEDLLIDTTFDPCYLSWDSTFNILVFNKLIARHDTFDTELYLIIIIVPTRAIFYLITYLMLRSKYLISLCAISH